MHAALSRDCSSEQRTIHQTVREALHLDDLLSRHFPALVKTPSTSSAAPALSPKISQNSSPAPATPEPTPGFNTETLRLVAFAQGLDAAARKKLEALFRCSLNRNVRAASAGITRTIAGVEQLLEMVAKLIARGANFPVDRIRGHLHILGEARSRGGQGTSPALLPVVSFTLVRTRDSIQPVYLDLGWYCIVHCATTGRTLVQTITIDDRPDTDEAVEVPALDWVLAHPLRHPETDKVFGVLSFDCLADETAATTPEDTLKALRWGKPDSDQPTAGTKSTLQQFGDAITKFLFAQDLRVWVTGE